MSWRGVDYTPVLTERQAKLTQRTKLPAGLRFPSRRLRRSSRTGKRSVADPEAIFRACCRFVLVRDKVVRYSREIVPPWHSTDPIVRRCVWHVDKGVERALLAGQAERSGLRFLKGGALRAERLDEALLANLSPPFDFHERMSPRLAPR